MAATTMTLGLLDRVPTAQERPAAAPGRTSALLGRTWAVVDQAPAFRSAP